MSGRWSTRFLLLSLIGATAIFSSTMSKSPILPLFAKYLGAGTREIGLIAAASTVVGIFMNITAGSLSDIYGRRRLIIASCIVFSTAPFLYLFITQVWQLVAVRLYHGLATAIFASVSMAVIADLFPVRRGEMMSLFSSIRMVGRLLAPVVGGLLLSFASFKAVYLICGVAGTIALLCSTRLYTDGGGAAAAASSPGGGRIIEGLKTIMTDVRILSASSTEAAIYFSIGSIETFLPVYILLLGMEPWVSGTLLMVQTFTRTLCKPVMGAASDRFGRRGLIALGLLLVTGSMLLIPLSRDFLVLIPIIVLSGVGISATSAANAPLIADIAPRHLYGSALGALETIKDVGHASGPIVAGILIAQTSYFTAFYAVGLLLIVDMALFLLATRGTHRGG